MLTAETKDNRRIAIVRIGKADVEEGSDELAGYEMGCPDRDLFGKPVLKIIHIGDVSRFLGSLAMSPIDLKELTNEQARPSAVINDGSKADF
jgi:hypothetical protein